MVWRCKCSAWTSFFTLSCEAHRRRSPHRYETEQCGDYWTLSTVKIKISVSKKGGSDCLLHFLSRVDVRCPWLKRNNTGTTRFTINTWNKNFRQWAVTLKFKHLICKWCRIWWLFFRKKKINKEILSQFHKTSQNDSSFCCILEAAFFLEKWLIVPIVLGVTYASLILYSDPCLDRPLSQSNLTVLVNHQ